VITGLIIGVVAALVGGAGRLLPDSDPGSVTGGVVSGMATVAGFASKFGAWLPFTQAAVCAGVLAALLLVGWSIHLVRMVLSFLTGGGGAA
jgi:hypothetical protein